jgi:polyisoprenoid-binding protein YceI
MSSRQHTAVSRIAIFALLSGGLAASAAAQRTVPSGAVRAGELSFDGRATAGDFVGKTDSVSGDLKGGPLESVQGWVEAPVTSLKTGNGRRDKDLNKSMESGKFPTIRFELASVRPTGGGDSVDAVLTGQFIIHGETRAAEVPATLLFSQDAVRVRATVPLNLKDYKIGGLSKMLGILKMHEDIVVHVDVTFAYQ